jgi:hypothetical protein
MIKVKLYSAKWEDEYELSGGRRVNESNHKTILRSYRSICVEELKKKHENSGQLISE